MFNGIIEEKVKIINHSMHKDLLTIVITRPISWQDCKIGDSISINGVCLTIRDLSKTIMTFDIAPHTLSITNFLTLKTNIDVLISRAMQLNDRLDGHILGGHCDGIGQLVKRHSNNNDIWLYYGIPKDLYKYLSLRDYISVNGASLTIARLGKLKELELNKSTDNFEFFFAIMLVPHSLKILNLHKMPISNKVNIEINFISKQIIDQINLNLKRKNIC